MVVARTVATRRTGVRFPPAPLTDLGPGPRSAAFQGSMHASAAACTPASQPGALPPSGGTMALVQTPARHSSQATSEFEFHMSPAPDSSRPRRADRHVGHEREQVVRHGGVAADPHRPTHREGRVGDRTTPPAAHLVAEGPPPPEGTSADRALGDDAPVVVTEPDRRHLDGGGHAVHADLEGGVEEIAVAVVAAAAPARARRAARSPAPGCRRPRRRAGSRTGPPRRRPHRTRRTRRPGEQPRGRRGRRSAVLAR